MIDATRHEIETMAARSMSMKFSSRALPISNKECRIWLFGGCGADEKIQQAITGIAKARGYDREQEWNKQAFVDFMTPLVGQSLAIKASGIIDAQVAG